MIKPVQSFYVPMIIDTLHQNTLARNETARQHLRMEATGTGGQAIIGNCT
jgi:hypothetical protein